MTILLDIPNFSYPTTVLSVNGWIVIQQRIDGSQSFNKNWQQYKDGFGLYNANFWLGLEKIYQLTSSAGYRLRFEILVKNGAWISDEYDSFKIDSEDSKYAINVSGYIGDNLDILNWKPGARKHFQNGMKFSTPDQDNTPQLKNCANQYSSGNWFNNCYMQDVNGIYGYHDLYYTAKYSSLTYCRMMIKLI
ncbi:hypothetical protein HELRODRAFT_81674 [Helobdella robusta]|uniref:Fibrinogen C-terminal domain-containing protein n=1 Tax=Helobdella robusta TaxID=6412 RepID=T1G4H3_HELRO|nr:hypothetical protein HELRODRAFT_81674 [Helobdella robusta]ESO01679.1 hypothetical protein HELRODRAFT_81674 [Helobdella robusta]